MEKLVMNKINELVDFLKTKKYSQQAIDLIYKSFLFAKKHHASQVRKSGEPYIIHPIATVKILASWDMDEYTLVAGMLHDVLEDTDCCVNEMIAEFGEEVTKLVKFVTKVSEYSKNHRKKEAQKTTEIENYSIQVFMSMTQDIRAMIIKIADRYHNMLTIKHLPKEKAYRIAKETLDIYANISGRLGMYKVKTELLDMSFEIIDNDNYHYVKDEIDNLIKNNQKTWDTIVLRIKNILEANNIKVNIEHRIKGIYSTFRKIQSGYEIKNIHDIFAIRLILDDVYLCYQTLGLIHMNFTYIINTFKDYISTPKWNLYQSIHTTIAQEETLVEVQIRTVKMNLFANIGLAAHWKYKENNKNKNQILLTVNNVLLRDFVSSSEKGVKNIKDITTGTIFDVLILNNQQWITVSQNSTLLDVAYKYDDKKFFNILAIYKNGERSHFDTHAENGDTIKISYSDEFETVKQNWIGSSNNNVVKKYIKDHLNKYELNKQITKEQFFEHAKLHLYGSIISEEHILKRLNKEFNVNSIVDFLDNVQETDIKQETVYNVFSTNKKVSYEAINEIKNQAWKWLANSSYFTGLENMFFTEFEISNCCSKVPGISCVAKISKNKFEIHRSDCPKVKNTKSKTIVVEWSQEKLEARPRYFKVNLLLKGNWTESTGNIISQTLIKMKANIAKIDINKNKQNKTHETLLKIYVKNYDHLSKIILELQSKNVMNDWRII